MGLTEIARSDLFARLEAKIMPFLRNSLTVTCSLALSLTNNMDNCTLNPTTSME
jgi:hypothetical protein